MKHDPPGLDYEPDPADLTGFRSLMPTPPPKRPGLIRRIVRLPIKLLALPFKAARAVVTAPIKKYRRGRAADTHGE